MTERGEPTNEYLVTVRGQLETTTQIYVHSEDEARRLVMALAAAQGGDNRTQSETLLGDTGDFAGSY
jgi:hypothetical protein